LERPKNNKFLAAVHEFKPDIVEISCLISAVYKTIWETVAPLKENIPQNLSPRAFIGGRVDELVRKDVEADYRTNDVIKTGHRFFVETDCFFLISHLS